MPTGTCLGSPCPEEACLGSLCPKKPCLGVPAQGKLVLVLLARENCFPFPLPYPARKPALSSCLTLQVQM